MVNVNDTTHSNFPKVAFLLRNNELGLVLHNFSTFGDLSKPSMIIIFLT